MKSVKNRKNYLILALLILAFSACNSVITTETPAPIVDSPSSTPIQETPEPQDTGILNELVVERTPIPTIQPGPIQQEVEKIIVRAGLSRTQVLGLNITDWVDILLSIIYILIGSILGGYLVKKAFQQVESRAPQGLNQEYVEKIGANLRWIVIIIVIFFSNSKTKFSQ